MITKPMHNSHICAIKYANQCKDMMGILNLGMAQTTKIEYSHPEVLVDTQWVEEHLNDPNIRIVEVDYDSQANYYLGHIPGAILLEWKKDINHPVSRDILSVESYKNILRKLGLDNDKSTTILLYGDFNNW